MIGVFDSGSGGLTVGRALIRRLPHQPFVYLGDHANAPYGVKPADDVLALTIKNVTRLFAHGCTLVLLACNTASAAALRRLQQDWLPDTYPDHRVLGVLVPLVEAVTEVPWHIKAPVATPGRLPKTVGIFATASTVASNAYPFEIGLRTHDINVVQQACDGLVDLIEDGADHEDIQALVTSCVKNLLAQLDGAAPDAVVLGCTHYPLVADAFAAALPPGIDILQQPEIVAESFADYLARHPRFAQGKDGAVRFLTTGDPTKVNRQASRFFGSEISFEKIEGAEGSAQ